MKKVAVVWGITIICVFGTLTFFGFKFQEIKDYRFLEMRMVDLAKEYNKDKKEKKITLDELKDAFKEENLEIKEENCSGYVKSKKILIFLKYKTYLKCNNYESKK